MVPPGSVPPADRVAAHSALLSVSAGLVGVTSYACTLLMANALLPHAAADAHRALNVIIARATDTPTEPVRAQLAPSATPKRSRPMPAACAGRRVAVTAVRARVGGSAQDTCRPNDTVDLLTRPGVEDWSGQRWTLAVTRVAGLAAIGENPGPPDSLCTGGDDGSDAVADQLPRGIGYATDCGLERFLSAFEDELFDSGSGITLDDYARLIAGSN
jgi:hypothetical protein